MLVFIDESYKKAIDPKPKTTFAAALLDEEKYTIFDTELFNLKKHFWKIKSPYDKEIKGRKLLSERAIELPKNREFISQVISLCKQLNIVVFSVTQDGSITLASQSDYLPELYRAILWRIDIYIREECSEDEKAIIFFDSIDAETNKKITISFNNFMYRHKWGKGYQQNILPSAFFANSLLSSGLQVADMLAYCANERYRGRRKYIEEIFQAFRDISYNYEDIEQGINIFGIQHIPNR